MVDNRMFYVLYIFCVPTLLLGHVSDGEDLAIEEGVSVGLVDPGTVRHVGRPVGALVVGAVRVVLRYPRAVRRRVEPVDQVRVGHRPPQRGPGWAAIGFNNHKQTND